MNTDKTTKRLLLAIALGLWANAAVQFVRPADLHAKSAVDMESDVRQIKRDVTSIKSDVGRIESDVLNIESKVRGIAIGLCLNPKIC